jgi:nucleotide-binding universal stress UspA family protein
VAEPLAKRLGARLVPLGQATVDRSMRGVDLVVTGSAHHEPEAGVWASPLSSRLVDRAPCPVLVTPPRVGAEAVPAGQPVTA